MSSALVVLLLLSTFVTSILSGIFGMAGGLLLMGALSLALSVPSAMVAHGFVQFWANGIRAYSLRAHIQWKVIAIYLLGALLAWILLFAAALVPSKPWLFVMMGLVPYLSLSIRHFHLDFQKPIHAFLCGFSVSGLQTLAGVAGPLLDIFFIRTGLNRHQIVATKAITQTLSHVLKVTFYLPFISQVQAELSWIFFALSVPSALLGTRIGVQILDRLSDLQFRHWTQGIVLLIGAVYLLKGLLLLGS